MSDRLKIHRSTLLLKSRSLLVDYLWRDEKSVLKKLRVHPDFVVFPPLRRGGRGGGRGTINYNVCPCLRGGKSRFRFPRLPPHTPGPPSQRGEKDRSLASSVDRAQQKYASRNRPSSTVNTSFSSPQTTCLETFAKVGGAPLNISSTRGLGTYLKVGDAAAVLGVSPWTLRHWDRSGKLKSLRHPVNGYRLYRREDLEALLVRAAGGDPRQETMK